MHPYTSVSFDESSMFDDINRKDLYYNEPGFRFSDFFESEPYPEEVIAKKFHDIAKYSNNQNSKDWLRAFNEYNQLNYRYCLIRNYCYFQYKNLLQRELVKFNG